MLGGALAKTSLTNLWNGCEFLANTVRDFLPAARICPEETVLFLQSQLAMSGRLDAWQPWVCSVLWLALMVSTTGWDFQGSLLPSGLCLHACFCASLAEPMMTEKLPQVVEAVQCLCSDPRIQVS